MKKALTFLLGVYGAPGLVSCSPAQEQWDLVRTKLFAHEDRFETHNFSSAQSKKDGVFLTSCSVAPASLAARDGLSLNVQEAFVEQRFSTGSRTGTVKLLDSLAVQPRLVVVFKPAARQALLVGFIHRIAELPLRGRGGR